MVLPRGSESWRKLSRFRRKSLVKPMAAEVLEPRCLMTDPTGTLAVADAAPLTGDVVIGPDQWDDAGLTLLRVGNLVHVVRTGTTQDVIAPFESDAPGKLIIHGRDDVRDVLTIDVSAFAAAARVAPNSTNAFRNQIEFDGGNGDVLDELHFVGSLTGFLGVNIDASDSDHWTQVGLHYQSNFGSSEEDVISDTYLSFRQFEQVVEDNDASLGTFTQVTFDGPDNDTIQVRNAIDVATGNPRLLISSEARHLDFQVPALVGVNGGDGDVPSHQ